MLNPIHHTSNSYYFAFQGQRNYQEDWFSIDDNNGIYMVCDGIGGGVKGDVASKGIVNALDRKKDQIRQVVSNNDLEKIILEAYQDWKASTENLPGGSSMGTTLVILLLKNNGAFVAHIGDSRAYYFKQGKLEWVTKDHSVVQELFDAGIIKNKVEMQNHPMKNRITNALVIAQDSEPPKVDVNKFGDIKKGDLFILCSDGAIEDFSDQDMENLFSKSSLSVVESWEKFKTKAKDSSDNSTAILVQV